MKTKSCVLGVLTVALLAACDQFSLRDLLTQTNQVTGIALALNPSSMTLQVNASYVFYGLGGTPPYSYSVVSPATPSGGTIDSQTGTYVAPAAVPGSSVTLRVTDNAGATSSATVAVVPTTGLPLSLNPGSVTLQLNAGYCFYAIGGSPGYTYSVVSPPSPAGGTIDCGTGHYTAPAAVPGSDVTLQAVDSLGAISTATVTVVTGSLGPLSMNPPAVTLQLADSYAFYALGGVPPYTYSVVSPPSPAGGTIVGASGLYTAPDSLPGSAVTVRVTDSLADTSDATVTVDPPQIDISPASVAMSPGDSLVFSAVGGTPPCTFVLDSGGGSVTQLTATSAQYDAPLVGPDVAAVRVADSAGSTASAVISVDTLPPLTLNPSGMTLQTGGVSYAFYALGGLPPYTYSVFNPASPVGGTIDAATGVYTPPAATPPGGTVVLQVTDSASATTPLTITIVASLPLGINPGSAVVEQGKTIAFGGFGGTAPYTYSVTPTTNVSINAGSGVLTATAAAVPGSVRTVTVTDGVSATATANLTIAPAAPSNLTATATSGRRINLAWTDHASGESGFEIYEKVGAGGTFTLIATTSADVQTYRRSSLTAGTVYTYKVRAIKNPGPIASGYSNEASAVARW